MFYMPSLCAFCGMPPCYHGYKSKKIHDIYMYVCISTTSDSAVLSYAPPLPQLSLVSCISANYGPHKMSLSFRL